MIFHFVPRKGFCITYETGPEELPLVMIGDGSPLLIEEVILSGNPIRIPQSYFVPAHRAFATAMNFMESGIPLDSHTWVVFDPKY